MHSLTYITCTFIRFCVICVLQALLKRGGHYWEILIDILSDRDSYRDTPKYRSPQPLTPRREKEKSSDKIFLTPQATNGPSSEEDTDKVSLLNEARMALANAAAYKRDISRALGLYSRVKTAQAAWNQAQVHVYDLHNESIPKFCHYLLICRYT